VELSRPRHVEKHRGNLNLRDVNYIGFEFLLAGKIPWVGACK
jgi:hypothetical protein